MRLNNDQKVNVIIASCLAIILVVISIWNRSSFTYIPGDAISASDAKKYEELLASIKPDKEASKKMLEKIVTEEEVRAQVEAELQVKQKVVTPSVPAGDVKISSSSDKDSVVNYFKNLATIMSENSHSTLSVSENSFQAGASVSSLNQAIASDDVYYAKLKGIDVPSDLVAFHKSQLLTIITHKKLLQTAKNYQAGDTSKPWPDIYREFQISNSQFAISDSEFDKVDKKYNIREVALAEPEDSSKFADLKSFFQIKEANAALGIGDTVIVVGDIPAALKEAIRQGFASAFGRFMSSFLDKMISKIEQNYKIANFLYYSDSLFTGQYALDYLDKYVTDPIDQEIVKRFLPEFACGANQNEDLKPILRAKAQEYLGYDTLSFDDPDYEAKLARAGEFMAGDLGQWAHFLDVRDATKNSADTAITRELTSSGLKSTRDLVGRQIEASLNLIENSESSALFNSLNLGVVNAENLISSLVSGILDNLFTKFIFQGAVFQEQNICAPLPVLNPILAAEVTNYETPDPNPDPDERFVNPNLNNSQENGIINRLIR